MISIREKFDKERYFFKDIRLMMLDLNGGQ